MELYGYYQQLRIQWQMQQSETQLSSYLISKDSCLRFQVLKGCHIQGGIFTNDAKTKGEIELGWYLFDIDLIKKKICFKKK